MKSSPDELPNLDEPVTESSSVHSSCDGCRHVGLNFPHNVIEFRYGIHLAFRKNIWFHVLNVNVLELNF